MAEDATERVIAIGIEAVLVLLAKQVEEIDLISKFSGRNRIKM